MRPFLLAVVLAGTSLLAISPPTDAQTMHCDIRPEGTTCTYAVDTFIVEEHGAFGLPTICFVYPYQGPCV